MEIGRCVVHLKNFFPKTNVSSKILYNIFDIIDHQRNLQILATSMYKILNGLSPDIMLDISKTKNCYYNIRNRQVFSSRITKTDMDYINHLLHGFENLGPCTQKRRNKLLP